MEVEVRIVSLPSAFRMAAAALALAGATFLSPQGAPPANAAAGAEPVTLGPSGLPLPRFVSLKASKVNLRIGPGLNYSVDWMYLKPGLPMEIVQEYDTWRRVRDAEGAEGWINQSLLSGKRTALAAPWQRGRVQEIALRADPSPEARTVARLEPGVMGTVKTCNGEWCRMDFDGHTGWLEQSLVWGVYPGEQVAD